MIKNQDRLKRFKSISFFRSDTLDYKKGLLELIDY